MDALLTSDFIKSLPFWLQYLLSWIVLISIIGGLIAALGPIYKLFFSKPKLVSKIMETYSNIVPGGNIYLFKIAIVNIGNKDFYPKIWRGKVRYSKDDKYHKALLMPARYFEMQVIGVKDIPTKIKKLKVNNIQYIQSFPILEKKRLISGYIAFQVPGYSQDKNIEKIIFEVSDFRKRIKKLKINFKEIKSEDLFHDDSIWQDIN